MNSLLVVAGGGALGAVARYIVYIVAGHVLGPDDIRLKSPGDGLQPYELDAVLGHALLQPINEDDEIAYQLLKRTPELARS